MFKHSWIQRSMVGGLLVALFLFTGCGGSGSTSDSNQPSPAASGNSNAGEVVISGAVSKSYTPTKVEAETIMSKIVINLTEKSANGVSVTFPVDTQPGTYTVVDIMTDPTGAVSGMYQVLSGGDAVTYKSTKGTLTLTATGSKFSGEFKFTAGDSKDASKTIEVTGSFTDAPFK